MLDFYGKLVGKYANLHGLLWGTLSESPKKPSVNRLLVTFTPLQISHLLMSRDTHGHQIVTIILEDRESSNRKKTWKLLPPFLKRYKKLDDSQIMVNTDLIFKKWWKTQHFHGKMHVGHIELLAPPRETQKNLAS